MATEWIIKLYPFGNPEDRQFIMKTVGGVGVEDFAGFHLEEFSFTTHATTGQATVTLRNTPLSLAQCYCIVGEDQRVIAPVSLGGVDGKDLTVQKRKLLYDKPATPVNGVSNAPSGVTVASASGEVTGDTAPTATSTPTLTPATDGSGAGPDDSISDVSIVTTVSSHHHTMNTLYDHKHTLTFSPTSFVAATSEATKLLVLYR